jgi:beta-N-acetylhexosaminidase
MVRSLLLAAIVALLALGTAARSPSAGSADPVDRLTLRQQVGQLVVLRFAGTSPPEYVRQALREGRAAGVILFRDNVASPAQLRALTRDLRREIGRPLVAVDQEGGHIRIVPWAPPAASAPEQQAAGSVRRDAERAARALRSLGITITLAPVGDVPSVPRAALRSRAFSSRVLETSAAMAASVVGWRAGGVASTAKHFPGLGAARVNTDAASVTISRTRAQLESVDLPPFAAAIEAGVPGVLLSHALYPINDFTRPGSLTRAVGTDLLRGDLGFKGVAITDDLADPAITSAYSVADASVQALRAGADLLFVSGPPGDQHAAYAAVLAAVRRGKVPRRRLNDALLRALEAKEDYGLIG